MLLYDSRVSGNCYKVRLLLAQLGIPTTVTRSTSSTARPRRAPRWAEPRRFGCRRSSSTTAAPGRVERDSLVLRRGHPVPPGGPFRPGEGAPVDVLRAVLARAEHRGRPLLGLLRSRAAVSGGARDEASRRIHRARRDRGAAGQRRVPRRRPVHDRRHRALRVYARRPRGRLRPRPLPGDHRLARSRRRPGRAHTDHSLSRRRLSRPSSGRRRTPPDRATRRPDARRPDRSRRPGVCTASLDRIAAEHTIIVADGRPLVLTAAPDQAGGWG